MTTDATICPTGFITRNGPETPENRRFLGIAKVHWLKRLATRLPTKLLDMSWPPCPATCQEASRELHRLHRLHLARKYRLALSPAEKKQFELKVLAEKIFKGGIFFIFIIDVLKLVIWISHFMSLELVSRESAVNIKS